LYSGMKVKVTGKAASISKNKAKLRLFVRFYDAETEKPTVMAYSESMTVTDMDKFQIDMKIPDTKGWPVKDFGFEIIGKNKAAGQIFINEVYFKGKPKFTFSEKIPLDNYGQPLAWTIDADGIRQHPFSDDPPDKKIHRFIKNQGRGCIATGNSDWQNYTFESLVNVHMADKAGIMVRYQGLERYIALVQSKGKLQLIKRLYKDHILAEINCPWKSDELHKLKLVCKGEQITAWCDSKKVFEEIDTDLGCGGVGFLFENGIAGICETKVG